MKHRFSTLAAAVAVSALALTSCASDGGSESSTTTDEYPTGDITWVIHAGAGGTSDLTARKLVEGLQDELGVSIIVENREGASGSLAVQHVAEQPADGYTIGYAPVEFALFDGLGFDVDPANYDFLGRLTLSPYVIAVPADSPYETLTDLLDHAADETITVSNAGAASLAGVVALAVGEETGTKISAVPFDGGAPAVAAVVGSQVDAVVALTGETYQQHEDGQLRVLAILGEEEHPLLPGVPTATELGYDLEYGAWGGVMAPAGLPDAVREKLEDAISNAATAPEFVEFVEAMATIPAYSSGNEFTSFISDETERFTPLLSQ